MNIENTLRLELNILSFAILAVIYFAAHRRSDRSFFDYRVFMAGLYGTTAILLMDTVGWAFGGVPGSAARAVLHMADSLYFTAHMIPPLMYVLYVEYQTGSRKLRIRTVSRICAGVFAICALFSLSSPWTGFIFSINAANRYSRGPGYPWLGLVLYAIVMYSVVLVILRRRRLPRRTFLTLFVYPLAPMLAAVLQTLNYGLVLLWPATTVSILIVFVNIQNHRIGTDYLTGTYNRYSLQEHVFNLLRRGGSAPEVSGILLDLDGFKEINDRLGHSTGDRALEEAATILHGSVRSGDFVSRYGGDEFVVILNTKNERVLSDVVQRIRGHFAASNAGRRRSYTLSVSLGAGVFDPALDRDSDSFLSRLDAAMYLDKMGHKVL